MKHNNKTKHSSNHMEHNDILKHSLLKPYIEKKDYYQKWGMLHKLNYWFFVTVQIILALGLAIFLIIYKNNEYTTFFAISLNFVLLGGQYAQFADKYKRYRLSEKKIEFLLLDFCNRYFASNKDLDTFIKENIVELGKKVENITLSEFEEHFTQLKNIADFSASSLTKIN